MDTEGCFSKMVQFTKATGSTVKGKVKANSETRQESPMKALGKQTKGMGLEWRPILTQLPLKATFKEERDTEWGSLRGKMALDLKQILKKASWHF